MGSPNASSQQLTRAACTRAHRRLVVLAAPVVPACNHRGTAAFYSSSAPACTPTDSRPQSCPLASCHDCSRHLCGICGSAAEAAQGCRGTSPPCCYKVYSTSVEGTTSTCCARYHSRGECRPIWQQEFNPKLLEQKIYSKISNKNTKFYYR